MEKFRGISFAFSDTSPVALKALFGRIGHSGGGVLLEVLERFGIGSPSRRRVGRSFSRSIEWIYILHARLDRSAVQWGVDWQLPVADTRWMCDFPGQISNCIGFLQDQGEVLDDGQEDSARDVHGDLQSLRSLLC